MWGVRRQVESEFDLVATGKLSYLEVVSKADELLSVEIGLYGASKRLSTADVVVCLQCGSLGSL
jgi:hypothetical protein